MTARKWGLGSNVVGLGTTSGIGDHPVPACEDSKVVTSAAVPRSAASALREAGKQRYTHRENRGNKNHNLRLCPTVYRAPFDTPRRWRRERRSVHIINVALLALLGALALVLGWQRVAMIHAC